MRRPQFSRTCLLVTALLIHVSCFAGSATAQSKSSWSGTRQWIGPEYWANPLTDWSLLDGEVVAPAAADRTLHQLVHQVVSGQGQAELEVTVRFEQRDPFSINQVGGFRVGVRGWLDDYRHALVSATDWIDAGIRADGRLILGDVISDGQVDAADWTRLHLRIQVKDRFARLVLVAGQGAGGESVKVETSVAAGDVTGNIALLSNGSAKFSRERVSRWHFKDWRVSGSILGNSPDQAFGPILWTQYSLSGGTLKLLAMMAPVDGTGEPVHLEFKHDGKWVRKQSAEVESLSRAAVFRIDDWDGSTEVPYRVGYNWSGRTYSWTGTIRKEPGIRDVITMAAFSCDNGYNFPNSRIVGNVAFQDPDILFFAGDQIYESFGGFGLSRSPLELAMLDYLRKYWQFGWSWRDLLKDRPSIIIPDDHDVFQGNLWGHGGRRIPDLPERPSGRDWNRGGYAMHPQWINAVERTQVASLPDPVDPEPAGQGIGVYFTNLVYGGLDIAILEDRKFKTGPRDPCNEEPQLLGPRQEAFLEHWVSVPARGFKVALSQTIFCDVATHAGQQLKSNSGGGGSDSNGWPKTKRDKALSILQGHDVVMVHGDQHLGALVHQGVDSWEDSAVAFMVPGSANGFPRAWWPQHPGENHIVGDPPWTGRYIDSLGNRMTVLAAANPDKASNLLSRNEVDPESIAHRKGSGHGVLRFDPRSGEVTFEMWRLQFDAANPQPSDQFAGFPKTLEILK